MSSSWQKTGGGIWPRPRLRCASAMFVSELTCGQFLKSFGEGVVDGRPVSTTQHAAVGQARQQDTKANYAILKF